MDPLMSAKCHGQIRILPFIEDEELIKKILKHLGLWGQKARLPPKTNAPTMAQEYHSDSTGSPVPPSLMDDLLDALRKKAAEETISRNRQGSINTLAVEILTRALKKNDKRS